MNIALLIICCLSMVFAFSFLMAAVFTFAACHQKPLDRHTDKLLSLSVWFGGGSLVYLFVVTRCWRHSQLGRRLFYAGSVSGVVAIACGFLAAHGV